MLIHKSASLYATTAEARFCQATIVERGRSLSTGRIRVEAVHRFSPGILIRNQAGRKITRERDAFCTRPRDASIPRVDFYRYATHVTHAARK